MVTVEDKGDVAAFASYTLGSVAPPPAPAAGVAPSSSVSPAAQVAAPPSAVSSPGSSSSSSSSPAAGDDRVFASPLARKLLRESGKEVSLSALRAAGSGPGGRVVAADVSALLARPAEAKSVAPPVPSAAPSAAVPAQQPLPPGVSAAFVEFQLSGPALARAAAATTAKQTVPHYYLSVDLNLESLLQLRAALNKRLDASRAVGVMELLVKAAALAMRQVPDMNAAWADGFVRRYAQVDVNVFVGSGDALAAPLVRDAASSGLAAIAAALAAPTEAPAAIVPGTFSVHNLGAVSTSRCYLNVRTHNARV